jgi:hypothetical protein
VDTANPNRAWISYMGFNAATPALPGHVFQVVYDLASNVATWTNLDGSGLGDLPANCLVHDSMTGDLYAATDFGVLRRAAGASEWTLAGTAMPNGEVTSLTIATSGRRLYAATHGLGAWSLALQ